MMQLNDFYYKVNTTIMTFINLFVRQYFMSILDTFFFKSITLYPLYKIHIRMLFHSYVLFRNRIPDLQIIFF